MVVAFTSVSCVIGSSRVPRLPCPCSSAWPSASWASTGETVRRGSRGSPELLNGIELVVVLVGLFAIGETIYVASRYGGGSPDEYLAGGVWMTREDWRR